MANTNEHDGEIIRRSVDPNDVMPMVDVETVELGANPKLVTTVKAWAPGKPPGGKLPTQEPEAKAPQEKS